MIMNCSNMSVNQDEGDRLLPAHNRAIDVAGTNSTNPKDLNDNEEKLYRHTNSTGRTCAPVLKQPILFGTFSFLVRFSGQILFSYISLYYKQLGFNASEIGVFIGIQPLLAIICSPFLGYMADKFAIRRLLLTGSLIGATIHIALYFIPKVRRVDCASLSVCDNSSTVNPELLASTITPYTLFYRSIGQHSLSISNRSVECQPDVTDTYRYLYNKDDLQTVFIYLVIVNILCQLVSPGRNCLSNSVVLEALGKERRNKYAYFLGIGSVGDTMGGLFGGLVLQQAVYHFTYCGIEEKYTNFFICFAVFSGLMLISAPIAWLMSSRQTIERTNNYNCWHLIRGLLNIRYGSVILTIFWLSLTRGYMVTYGNWYIHALGGSFTFIGWSGVFGEICGIATFFCLPAVNKKIGHLWLLVIASLIVTVGCAVAGFVTKPEWMLIPIACRKISVAIFLQSSGTFMTNIVEPQYLTTMQSLMTAITFGLGRGVGSLLGGGLINAFSPAMTYLMFAVVSFLMGLLLVFVQVVHTFFS